MMDPDRSHSIFIPTGHGAFCDQIAKTARAARADHPKETAVFSADHGSIKTAKAHSGVGTAVGYSALLMAQVMPEGTDIITIEKYEPRIPVARRIFEKAGMSDRITF